MKRMLNKIVSIALSLTMIGLPPALVSEQAQVAPLPQERKELQQLVTRPYLELLELASSFNFTAKEIEAFKAQLDRDREAEKKRLEQEEKSLKLQIEQARKQLDALNKRASQDTAEMAEERRRVQCDIYKWDRQMAEKRTARQHGVGVAFDNKRAKVDLIAQWPAKKREIDGLIASGRARQRVHGDVEDIGIRIISEGQEKDIKLGQDAINQMKMYSMFPPEVEDKELNEYIRRLADAIAVNSDLKIPLKVTLLESNEINAFALPGGFLYINTGLLEKAGNESELVGVMAHELAHVTARHGARLMKRATIAGIIYQAAQVAAMIFTGGLVGIGTYYALEYGFFGLGLLLDLALLGVSREFEAEADQLGVQYAWKAGYDPRGFITLFDRMASEEGYVKSASFFRTHPPFFDRIWSTFGEIEYLPKTPDLQVDSTAFQKMKEKLKQLKLESRELQKKRPTLRRMPQCEDEPAAEKKPPAIS
ncbi:MAG: M48 family metalloprotease [Blastocatellia bacterium]|nr:M48 family metalloprotease [Blastocatellia bacterium]